MNRIALPTVAALACLAVPAAANPFAGAPTHLQAAEQIVRVQAGESASAWLAGQGIRLIDGYAAIDPYRSRHSGRDGMDPWTIIAKSLELQARGGALSALSDADLYDVALLTMTSAERAAFNEAYFGTRNSITVTPGQYDPFAFQKARPALERQAARLMPGLAATAAPIRIVLPVSVRAGHHTAADGGMKLALSETDSVGRTALRKVLQAWGTGRHSQAVGIAAYDLRSVPTVIPLTMQAASAVMNRTGGALTLGLFIELTNPRLEDGALRVDATVDRLAFYADPQMTELVWAAPPSDGWDLEALAQARSDQAPMLDAHTALLMVLERDRGRISSPGFHEAAINAQTIGREETFRRRNPGPTTVPLALPKLVANGRTAANTTDRVRAAALYAKHLPPEPIRTVRAPQLAPYYVRRRDGRAPQIDMGAAASNATDRLRQTRVSGNGALARATKSAHRDAKHVEVALNSDAFKVVFVFADDPFYDEIPIGADWPADNQFNVDMSFAVEAVEESEFDGARLLTVTLRPAQANAYGAGNQFLGDLVAIRADATRVAAETAAAAADAERRAAETAAAAERQSIDAARNDASALAILDIQLGDTMDEAIQKAFAHYKAQGRGTKGSKFARAKNPIETGFFLQMMDSSNTYPTDDDSLTVFTSRNPAEGVIGVYRTTYVGGEIVVDQYVAALTERYGEPLSVYRSGDTVRVHWGVTDHAVREAQRDGWTGRCFYNFSGPVDERVEAKDGKTQTMKSSTWHNLDPKCGPVLRVDVADRGVLKFYLADAARTAAQPALLERDLQAATANAKPKIKF